MKRLASFLIAWFLLFCAVAAAPASAQLFGSEAKNWEKVLVELKKINARLVTLHTRDLPTLHGNQADLKDQMDNVRGLLPALQGKMEESNTRQDQRFGQLDARIGQIETLVKGELERQTVKQQAELTGFKKDMVDKFEQLKLGLARDMETFAASNQKQFQGMKDQNDKAAAAMKLQLDKQADLSGKVIDHLGGILDAGARQYQDLDRRLDTLQQALATSQKTLAGGFSAIEANNKVVNANTGTITEVLKKGFTEQEKIRLKVEALETALAKTGANVDMTRKAIGTLKEILDPKLDQLTRGQADFETRQGEARQMLTAGQKQIFDQLAADQTRQKQTEEKFGKLVDSTQAIITHSGRTGEQITQLVGKVEHNQGEVNLANEKLTKLIEILKTMAQDQQKLENLLKSDAEIRESLADLRRKANVAISRNDDILKLLKPEGGPAPGKSPGKG